jgi:leader peptidase (prepilin peptidase) / N-methyltransferase
MALFLVFIIGTIVGSFVNVCIYRLPRKESIMTPRSHCPSCGKVITWFDNVPVISYLALKGKCRWCGSRISPRYLIVEVLSGIICALLFLRFGLTAKFFILWYLASALTAASFIDQKFQEIPDEITISGVFLGLCASAFYPPLMNETGNVPSFLNSFLGVITGGASIYTLGFIGEFIFKREAMGGGDVKLMAMIGAFLGWKKALFSFFLAPFFGSIIGIILRIKEGKEFIPYGPYLSLAAVVAIFWGDAILNRFFLF